jgi:hypothetical protein
MPSSLTINQTIHSCTHNAFHVNLYNSIATIGTCVRMCMSSLKTFHNVRIRIRRYIYSVREADAMTRRPRRQGLAGYILIHISIWIQFLKLCFEFMRKPSSCKRTLKIPLHIQSSCDKFVISNHNS